MTVRFLFIFGWLRVAETLYNPFGEDDEDFELNELLNRHFKIAMSIVDDNEDPPELKKDIIWNKAESEIIEHLESDEMNTLENVNFVEKRASEHIISMIGNGNNRDTML
jgi:hypothetical protein